VSTSRATDTYVTVTSTNNGSGLFSFTFNAGTPGYVWQISSNDLTGIFMPAAGVQQIFNPAGWTGVLDPGDIIHWYSTNSTFYIGEPSLTFSYQSYYHSAALYSETDGLTVYDAGIIVGTGATSPDHEEIG